MAKHPRGEDQVSPATKKQKVQELSEALNLEINKQAEDNKKLREQIEELTKELNLAHSIAKVANDTLKYTTDELVCPITHELPIDPVIARDGRIYERSAIKTWFESKDTSPCTNKKIGKLLVRAPHVKNIIKKIILTGVVNMDEASTGYGVVIMDEELISKWNERWNDISVRQYVQDVLWRQCDAARLAMLEAKRRYDSKCEIIDKEKKFHEIDQVMYLFQKKYGLLAASAKDSFRRRVY